MLHIFLGTRRYVLLKSDKHENICVKVGAWQGFLITVCVMQKISAKKLKQGSVSYYNCVRIKFCLQQKEEEEQKQVVRENFVVCKFKTYL